MIRRIAYLSVFAALCVGLSFAVLGATDVPNAVVVDLSASAEPKEIPEEVAIEEDETSGTRQLQRNPGLRPCICPGAHSGPFVEPPFYGMQYVPEEDLAEVASLGVNTVLQDFSIDGSPAEWIAKLDVAAANDLSVVAWQWSPGWEWDEAAGEWDVDRRAVSFLETVEGHPALFAVYGTHEAYWNGCFGCGYTSEQLRMLYSQIKAIADVPVYSAFDGFEFWRQRSPETTFSDGICDFCDTWYYPNRFDIGYDRDEYIDRLATEIATFRELAPNSKFVWVLQAFESELSGRRMPNRAQLNDMASIAVEADIDGLWWYTWSFDRSQYEEVLGDHPELHDVVRNSYSTFFDRQSEAQ